MLLSEIATRLGGSLIGEDREINTASTLDEATAGDISFLANPKYRHKADTTAAGGILVGEDLGLAVSQVVVAEPYLAFAAVLELLYPAKRHTPGISPQASVDASATVDPGVTIYPHVFVGPDAHIHDGCVLHPGCYIGDGVQVGVRTVLHPNVVIYDGCRIGEHCIVHAGTIIGSDGFGFTWDGTCHRKVPQKGIVIVGDHVEIGANCTIDRAALTSTVIGNDVKTDNLVQIGHNVVIGDHCILVAQSGVAGSSRLGRGVTLAGQSGVAGHITVGDGVTAAARTVIVADTEPGKLVSGYPAMDHRHWLRVQKVYRELPDLLKRIRKLERRTEDLDQH